MGSGVWGSRGRRGSPGGIRAAVCNFGELLLQKCSFELPTSIEGKSLAFLSEACMYEIEKKKIWMI
jgi:hypothetical protein